MMMIIIIVIIVVVVSGLLSSPIAHYDPTKIEFLRKNESTKKRERCVFFFLFCSEFFTEEETERLYKKRGEGRVISI